MLFGGVQEGVYRSWVLLMSVCGPLAALVLVVAGFGLWRMKPWGRLASVGYAWYALVTVGIGLIMNWRYAWGPLFEQLESMQDPSTQGILIGTLVAGVIGIFFGLAYPSALLYFMTRPRLVLAFEGGTLEAPQAPASAPISDPISTPTTDPTSPRPLFPSPESAADWDGRSPYAAPEARVGAAYERPEDRGEEILRTIVPVRNKPALVAYYLGVFSLAALIPFLGVVGIGMGIVAVVQGLKGRRLVLDHPEVKGKIHAWVGILFGGLWATLGLAMHALFLFFIIAG